MARSIETCFNYCGEQPVEKGYFSSDEVRWINRIHKLKEEHPDEVEILKEPEDNDGCIYCKIPTKWMKLQPPKNLSEELREAARERITAAREKKTK